MAPCSRFPRLIALFAILFSLSLPLQSRAQDGSNKTESQPKPAAVVPVKLASKDKATSAAAKARIEQQKALGLSLLVSLANDARNFSDQKLRARTLARIADALWEADPEQGRALFRKAWDAAEVADQEAARQREEDRQSPGGGAVLITRPDLRAEVLRLAAKRDRALGEELLDKLKEAKKQEAADATSARRSDSVDTPAAIQQRLGLARQLLESDVERALQFADPALTTVTMEGLNFLSFLREKNPVAADQRYTRMLAIADADLKSDANTISLLSSYVFTPHFFITIGSGGDQSQSQSQMGKRMPAPQVASELRNTFFRTAAQVLLRPLATREQDRSSSGLEGKYVVIKRLLPLFEQYAAKEIVDQLRSEMAVLEQGGHLPDTRDNGDESPFQRGNSSERSAEDVEKAVLDRIDRAQTSAERDSLYLDLAIKTSQKGDMRARDFTDKIEDSELRKQARPYVDMTLGLTVVEKKDPETILLLVSKGEFSHLQKAWLLTQAAKALSAKDRERALDTITEAVAESRRIDVSDPDRPRALIAVANAFLAIDRTRAWETMLEVAKASNSVKAFTGEDGGLVIKLETKNMMSIRTSTEDDFDLPGIFRTLSQENSTQAVELARSFEGEAPRASALIAVARSLLNDKK